MNIKRITALGLCLAMLLCACNGNNADDNTTTTPAPQSQQQGSESESQSETTTPTSEESENTSSDTSSSEEESVPPVTEPAGSVPDDYREYGENGILVVGRNGHYVGLSGCWGTLELCDSYTASLNKAAELLPDVNVYDMIAPTAVEFYLPDDVTGFTGSQKEKIDHVKSGLKNVTEIDAYGVLQQHQDEYIYSRTDHHWQPLGAYYAAKEFAQQSGTGDLFPALSEYEAVTKEGYVGSYYNYSKCESLKSDPEPFTLYISPNADALTTTYYDTSFQNGEQGHLFPYPDASGYYLSFLGTDICIAEIDTDCKNGRTLVICKESYGNALVPFLTSCYEKIYVTDMRYFDINLVDFCKEVGATDLLFACCTFTPAGGNGSYLEDIIK